MLVSAPGPSLYEELLQGLAAADLPYEALSPAVRADIEAESWAVFQRPSQSLMWGEDWRIRAWITGRGFGKNRSAAEGMIQAADEHGVRHMAAIGQTFTDVSGLMLPDLKAASRRRWGDPGRSGQIDRERFSLELPYGRGRVEVFSAEKPRSSRGPNKELVWCDELATWSRLGDGADDPWEMVQMMTRVKSAQPARILVTSTPRPVPAIEDLLEDTAALVTTGSTYDNRSNLDERFLASLGRLEGTRLGRQEVYGEVLSGIEGAMWTAEDLRRARLPLDDAPARARYDAVVVAVDPSSSEAASSDYTGIVVMGRIEEPDGLRGYVLHSERMRAEAPEWGARVAQLYGEWAADVVVVEANMAIAKDVLRLLDPTIPCSQGVRGQAQMVARGTVAGGLPARADPTRWRESHEDLEHEMRRFTRASVRDDLVDALVWAARALQITRSSLRDYGSEEEADDGRATLIA